MNNLDRRGFEFQKRSCPPDLSSEYAPNLLRKVNRVHFNVGRSPRGRPEVKALLNRSIFDFRVLIKMLKSLVFAKRRDARTSSYPRRAASNSEASTPWAPSLAIQPRLQPMSRKRIQREFDHHENSKNRSIFHGFKALLVLYFQPKSIFAEIGELWVAFRIFLFWFWVAQNPECSSWL